MKISEVTLLEDIRPVHFPPLPVSTIYRKVLSSIMDGTDVAPEPIRAFGLAFVVPCKAEWGYGFITGDFIPPEHAAMPSGNIFGGYLTALVDQWAGLATYSVAPDELQILTVNMNVDFMAPAATALTRIESRIASLTESKVIVDVSIRQHDILVLAATVVEALRPWRSSNV